MNEESDDYSRRNFLRSATVLGVGTMLSACSKENNVVKPSTSLSLDDVNLKEIDFSHITQLSAVELSQAIKTKRVSYRQVMLAYLEKIKRLNPTFNAIVALQDEDNLLAQADKCDRDLAAGKYRSWMHDFPLAVKDLASTKGITSTSGSPILKGLYAALLISTREQPFSSINALPLSLLILAETSILR